jgi:urease accessory protein UreF
VGCWADARFAERKAAANRPESWRMGERMGDLFQKTKITNEAEQNFQAQQDGRGYLDGD